MQYDLIIIGGSAAGASATVYARRRGLSVAIIAKDLGGEVATSGEIENWLGVQRTTGVELSEAFRKHMQAYKPDIKEGFLVTKVEKRGEGDFVVTADDGSTYEGKAVLVASGMHPRELGVPGEKEFRNRGVSYCTVCDGPLFQGKTVATIGGGNSALESALMLADIATKVYVINKNAQFKGEQVLIDNLQKKKNVEVIYEAMTTAIEGEAGKFVNGLRYTDANGAEQQLAVEGIFVHIGSIPNSEMVGDDVQKDEYKAIVVDQESKTSVPGLFAAGDVTNHPYKQIVVAAGMGCAAALSAVQYINRLSQ